MSANNSTSDSPTRRLHRARPSVIAVAPPQRVPDAPRPLPIGVLYPTTEVGFLQQPRSVVGHCSGFSHERICELLDPKCTAVRFVLNPHGIGNGEPMLAFTDEAAEDIGLPFNWEFAAATGNRVCIRGPVLVVPVHTLDLGSFPSGAICSGASVHTPEAATTPTTNDSGPATPEDLLPLLLDDNAFLPSSLASMTASFDQEPASLAW